VDLTTPTGASSELAAAFLQAAITVGLAAICGYLFHRYRKPYFAWLALAWVLYALRLGAIISFLASGAAAWLYWHQVATGWTALVLLWAALVFSQQLRWRPAYFALVAFPPAWSYVAIYRLDNFLLAAGPAVLFLSGATLWTGWVFARYHRRVGSPGAALLAVALCLWGLHHLDYPFLRARGAWNPWGYYLDILFELALGAGFLLLVLEDVRRGLETLAALSGDLQRTGDQAGAVSRLLERPLTLAGVRGSALFLRGDDAGRFTAGAGICAPWAGTTPEGAAAHAIAEAVAGGRPQIVGQEGTSAPGYRYAAALPVLQGAAVTGALLIVGDARDPFAALDTPFLVALGQQVGAALESADLYRRVEERRRELERLAGGMVRQHEAERRRLSRELHDETAQVLSAVRLKLGVLREQATPGLTDRLDDALRLMDAGIQSIRNVTNALRPSLLDDLGLVPALRGLVQEVSDRTGLDVRLEVTDRLPPLSNEAEVALFRALQEGLTNVVRHAGARSVMVTLDGAAGEVALRIRDDGRGPPPATFGDLERDGHRGLAGMRERITVLGGSLAVRGGPDRGCELVVRLPDASRGAA